MTFNLGALKTINFLSSGKSKTKEKITGTSFIKIRDKFNFKSIEKMIEDGKKKMIMLNIFWIN